MFYWLPCFFFCLLFFIPPFSCLSLLSVLSTHSFSSSKYYFGMSVLSMHLSKKISFFFVQKLSPVELGETVGEPSKGGGREGGRGG